MILFSQRRKLGELYKQWIKDHHVLDCPSSVVDFLQINGLLNEEKAHVFLAVKTNTIIDDEGNSSRNHKEDNTIMANQNGNQDKNGANGVPQVPDEPKTPETNKNDKENIIVRGAKRCWRGVKNTWHAIRKSPWSHLAVAGFTAAGTLAAEEMLRRKFSGSDEVSEDEEPIETEFLEETEEEPDDIGPTEEDDEMTE